MYAMDYRRICMMDKIQKIIIEFISVFKQTHFLLNCIFILNAHILIIHINKKKPMSFMNSG